MSSQPPELSANNFDLGDARFPLEKILITDQLAKRTSRAPNFELESRTLRELSHQLSLNPSGVLQQLSEKAIELCGAGSAGVSIAETLDGQEVFRWHAIAGVLQSMVNGTIPRRISPCAVVIERGCAQLMKDPARYFSSLKDVGVPVHEVLLIPFYRYGVAVGTIWVVSHDEAVEFDAEDSRLMHALAEFTSAASQVYCRIEETVTAQKELMKSQEQLATAVAVSKVGFFDSDLLRQRAIFSDQFLADWGLEQGANSEEVYSRIHPADLQYVQALVKTTMETGVPYHAEYRIIPAEGKLLWISANATVTYDANGQPVRFFGTSQDITERKNLELNLSFERYKLEAIFRDSPAAMVLCRGSDFVFEMVNPLYQSIFPDRELVGKKLSDAFPEICYQPFGELLKKVFETGVPFVGNEVHAQIPRVIDGVMEDRYFDFTYVRINDIEGKPYGVYDHAIDVTERVLARRAAEAGKGKLEGAVANLRQERDLRDHFVSALTHDLRTPLTVVKLNGQNILRLSAGSDVVKRMAQRIVSNVERTDRMIQDLLDAARIKAGDGIPVRLEVSRLDKIISTSVDELQEIYGPRMKYINTIGEVDGCWDAASLRRVIENLTNNAFKYGAKNTPVTIELSGDLDAEAARGDSWVLLSIHNEGDPISPEDQKSLFTVYRRTNAALSSGHRGWGIGLTLVKGIVMAHAGHVMVTSSPAHGTTFYVRLPVRNACSQLSGEFR